MLRYETLTADREKQIAEDRITNKTFGFDEEAVIRRNPNRDRPNIIRTAFIRDIDKIIH